MDSPRRIWWFCLRPGQPLLEEATHGGRHLIEIVDYLGFTLILSTNQP